ncbi:MAG TPA: Crp/Fnr family transcriptional regulator [Casimicrobium sp.]|nr:Crp/Fnr family transcriptional regulator [Casimicrobium sp.]
MAIPIQNLAQFPLLESLPQDVLLHLSSEMVERKFARREIVISKEQHSHELGFLAEGRLQGVDFTVDGRGVGLYFVDSGDFFGELSVVDGLRPAEHVIAAARSTAVFLSSKQARALLFDNTLIAQRVLTRLAARVREVTAQRTLLGLPNPFQRLCVQLLQLARPGSDGSLCADPAPTHQELAIMINASRETVTRAFQTLALHEAIRRDGSSLRLLRPDFLSAIGNGRQEPPKN